MPRLVAMGGTGTGIGLDSMSSPAVVSMTLLCVRLRLRRFPGLGLVVDPARLDVTDAPDPDWI